MITPELREDNLRREALLQALRLYEGRIQMPSTIVVAAKAFEEYLKGESK